MADTVERSEKFRDMGAGGKLTFIGKVLIFIVTFGFVFPTILND